MTNVPSPKVCVSISVDDVIDRLRPFDGVVDVCAWRAGENALHMAVVNEDPAMVKFLLDCGADFNQRCCGNFFTPRDQQTSRRDSDQHECFDVPTDTNYEG